jgi:DnaJ-class molecular chaperone
MSFIYRQFRRDYDEGWGKITGKEWGRMAIVTHYTTLKVSQTASTEVIRAAYRSLAQKYHPDRNLNNPEAVLMMQLINIAYNTLTDEKKRQEHDYWIVSQEPKKPPPPESQLSPEEKAKREKLAKEIGAWESFAAKEQKEAEAYRAKADKAAQQAASAAAFEKAKWDAYAKQCAEEATKAEAKAAKAAKDANEKIAALGVKPIVQAPPPRKITTHYDTFTVARDAPLEVIKGVHKMLSLKYQGGESGPTAESAQMLQILNEAYKVLTDPQKRAEHDKWIESQEPKKAPEQKAASNEPRKETARERDFQLQAEKIAKEAAAFKAAADSADAQAKELEAKAAKAQKDAAANANGKDAAKWQAFAAKEAANAKEARDRATKAAEKAKAEQERAAQAAEQAKIEKARAVREAAEKLAEDEKNRKLWEKNK